MKQCSLALVLHIAHENHFTLRFLVEYMSFNNDAEISDTVYC